MPPPKTKTQQDETDSADDHEEKIVKYHARNSISSLTLLLFIIISIATAYENLNWNIEANSSLKQTGNKTRVENNTRQQKNAGVSNSNKKTKRERAKKSSSIKSKINSITNEYDRRILSLINDGEHYYNRGQYPECISHFEKLLKQHPRSPRAMFGQAKCLDKLAEEMRSNELLSKAIDAYAEVAKQPAITNELLKQSLLSQSERLVFYGKTRESIKVLAKLTERVPNDIEVLNKLGTSYLIMGQQKNALEIHKKVIDIDPGNGVANGNIGYILKASKKFNEAIPYLETGIKSGDPETNQAKFYVFLGEAYTKTNRTDDAWKLYNQGAERGHFLSASQRSTENSESKLRAQPWWEIEESGHEKELRKLEYYWRTIRDEVSKLLKENKDKFPLENEGLLHTGDWRQFNLYQRGQRNKKNCELVPRTCEIISQFKEATSNKRGQIKFSMMTPGTHVWAHTGPTNCRLRAHLGLVVPKGVEIRVGSKTRTWENGKVLLFDDSFDHEVWHRGTETRLILIIDFWHPDLPQWEKQSLAPV